MKESTWERLKNEKERKRMYVNELNEEKRKKLSGKISIEKEKEKVFKKKLR